MNEAVLHVNKPLDGCTYPGWKMPHFVQVKLFLNNQRTQQAWPGVTSNTTWRWRSLIASIPSRIWHFKLPTFKSRLADQLQPISMKQNFSFKISPIKSVVIALGKGSIIRVSLCHWPSSKISMLASFSAFSLWKCRRPLPLKHPL